ncbi:hypothetical protein NE237_016103 [Protea cynaroides]|uniref:Uncharacterized protein n=1 Tax=Protea cynaroides TaxID=273540 RepID=A0A9Q0QRN9_9MAGN|nr:hypothetical protein NE237_016103 [Protea cynaroides]
MLIALLGCRKNKRRLEQVSRPTNPRLGFFLASPIFPTVEMLENPTDLSIPPTTVKRYAPPNQRNRVHNRRKSGDRFERTSSSHSNDGEKNQTSSRNTPTLDHTEAVTSNHLNENSPSRLIALNGCCSSEAAQLLNDRWAAAIYSYNDPTIDLSERPVMYAGSGASAWGHPRLPPQVDFLADLQRAIRNAHACADA